MIAAALSFARGVPLLAWACLGLLLAVGVQTSRLKDAQVDLANEKAAATAQRVQLFAAAAKAGEEYRAEEQRRIEVQQEVARVAQKAHTRALDDRRAADAAAIGLRQRVATAASSCRAAPADPAVATPGPAASAAGDLLADVLGRLDEAAGELAAAADAARIAGFACQQSYEALKTP